MIASDKQGGREVLGQDVQPGHVEVVRHRALTCNGHTPTEGNAGLAAAHHTLGRLGKLYCSLRVLNHQDYCFIKAQKRIFGSGFDIPGS